MTWTINIGGSAQSLQGDEKAQYEQSIIDKAREFAATLPDVSTASVTTNTQGTTDVRAA